MATTMENPTTMTTKPNTTHHKDEVPTTMLETTKDTNTVRKLRFQIRLENHPDKVIHQMILATPPTMKDLRERAVILTFPEATLPIDWSQYDVIVKHGGEGVDWWVTLESEQALTLGLQDDATRGIVRLSVQVSTTVAVSCPSGTKVTPPVSPKRQAALSTASRPVKAAKNDKEVVEYEEEEQEEEQDSVEDDHAEFVEEDEEDEDFSVGSEEEESDDDDDDDQSYVA